MSISSGRIAARAAVEAQAIEVTCWFVSSARSAIASPLRV